MSYDPFKQMGPGMFNPGVAGRMAARKENEESKLRELQQMNSYALIKDRMSRLKDFEAGAESRRAKEGYETAYNRARLPYAARRAEGEQGKLDLDNDTAGFDLRNKRHKMAQEVMPAIMRLYETDPRAGQALFEKFAPLFGGADFGSAGKMYGNPLQTPKHQRELDTLRVKGENQRRAKLAGAGGRTKAPNIFNVEILDPVNGERTTIQKEFNSQGDWEDYKKGNPGAVLKGKVGSTPQPQRPQSLTAAGGPVATYVLSNGSTYVGTFKEAESYARGQGLQVVDIQSRRKADGGGDSTTLPPVVNFGPKGTPTSGISRAAGERKVTKIDKNGNVIK